VPASGDALQGSEIDADCAERLGVEISRGGMSSGTV